MKLKALLIGAAFAVTFTSASALLVQEGNIDQIDSLVVRNPCGLAAGTANGNPVLGCLQDDHDQLVSLSSDEDLAITGGQATLDSADGTFSKLSVSLVAASLGTAIMNIDATARGFVVFSDGSDTSAPFALALAGNNFFTVTGITGDFLSFITYTGSIGNLTEADIVADVKQIRLGVAPIPEPETYALMMAGLAALGFVSRRRKAKR